jgi:hypothetical protein
MTDEAHKICSVCNIEKSINEFSKGKATCKLCCSLKTQKYNASHKKEKADYDKQYASLHKNEKQQADAARYERNKEQINIVHKVWVEENKEHLAQYNKNYREDNKEYFTLYNREYSKNRKKNDPVFKLRKEVSSRIAGDIKRQGSSKNGSITQYLDYSIQDLKDHLENKFECWMSWDNRGVYNPKTWDDNDQSTWTWQLDHIIPQSDLPYTSMEDDNFKKCWALGNLRPLSAKLNLLEGSSRIRHKNNT